MNDCIFCKIIKNEIPSYKVYEDEDFIAFLDVAPLNPGHTLLAPKKHVEWVNDYEPFCKYWKKARELSYKIQKAMNCKLISYVVYGLGVPHAHIHLIPKFENDAHQEGPNPEHKVKLTEKEFKEVAEKIKKEIEG